MLAVLQFIFSDFWVWAGTVVLVAIVALGIAAFTPVTIYRGED